MYESEHMDDVLRSYEMQIESMSRDLTVKENQIKDLHNNLENCLNENYNWMSRNNDLEVQLKFYETMIVFKDKSNKVVLGDLETERITKAKLEAALKNLIEDNRYFNDMLGHVRCVLLCIIQKMEKCDCEREEFQRRLILDVNKSIRRLLDHLDSMEGNKAKSPKMNTNELEITSKKYEQVSKTCNCLQLVLQEKSKVFESMKVEMSDLRRRLDHEQKLRENTEIILADVRALGNTQLSVIQELSTEINRLFVEVEEKGKKDFAGQVPAEMQRERKQIQALRLEVDRLTAENSILKHATDTKLQADRENETLELLHKPENGHTIIKNEIKQSKEKESKALGIIYDNINEQFDILKKENEDQKRQIAELTDIINQLSKNDNKQKKVENKLQVKSKSLSTQCDSFNDELDYSKNEQQKKEAPEQEIEEENQKLRLTVSRLEKQFQEMTRASDQNVEFVELKVRLDECQNKEKAYVSKIQDLSKMGDEKNEENKNLRLKLSALEKQRGEITQDSSNKEDVLTELNQKNEENRNLRLKLSALEKQLDETIEDSCKKDDAVKEVQKKNEEIKNLRLKVSAMERQLGGTAQDSPKNNDVLKEVEQKNEENKNLLLKVSTLEKQLGEMTQGQTKIQQDVELKTNLDVAQKRVNELEKDCSSYESKSISMKKQIADLRDELTKVKANHTRELLEKESAVKQAEIKKARGSSEVEEVELLEGKILYLQAEVDRLNSLFTKPKGEVQVDEHKEKQFRDLIESIRDLQRKNEHLKSKIVKVELENGRLRNDLETITGEGSKNLEKRLEKLGELENKIAHCTEKTQHMRARVKQLENESKSVKKEYIDVIIAKEKLTLINNEQDQRLRETRKMLEKCQQNKQQIYTQLGEIKIENENLKTEIFLLTGQESKVSRQTGKSYDDLKLQNERLEVELNEIKKIVDEPEAEIAVKKKFSAIEAESATVKKELEGIKGDSFSDIEDSDFHRDNPQIDAIEMEIANEQLKRELSHREKIYQTDLDHTRDTITDLETELLKFKEMNDYLKVKNIEVIHDNEYLRKEIARITAVAETLDSDPVKNLQVQEIVRKYQTPTDLLYDRKSIVISSERMRELEESVAVCESEKKELGREIEVIRKQLDSLPKQYRQQLSDEHCKNEELKAEIETFRKIKKLQNELNRNLEKQLQDVQAKLDKLIKSRRVSFDDMTPLLSNDAQMDELKEKGKQLDELSKKIMEQTKQISDLEDQLEKCRDTNRKLKQQTAEVVDDNETNKPTDHKDKDKSNKDQPLVENQSLGESSGTEVEVEYVIIKQLLGNVLIDNVILQSDVSELKNTQRNLEQLASEKELLQQEKLEVEERMNSLKHEMNALHRRLASKRVFEHENKTLKKKANRLTQELLTRDQDCNNLRDELVKIRIAKDELLKHIDYEQNEIYDLRSRIRLLGGGEVLDANEEVSNLKLKVEQLTLQVDNFKRRLAEVGRGDADNKCSRKFEAILQKYRDNHESLNVRIMRLEAEKSRLKMEIDDRIDILQQYREENERLKGEIARLRSRDHNKEILQLEEEVNRCKINNRNLEAVTVQLETEVKCLKEEIERFMEHGTNCNWKKCTKLDSTRSNPEESEPSKTAGKCERNKDADRKKFTQRGTNTEHVLKQTPTMVQTQVVQSVPMFLPCYNYTMSQPPVIEPKIQTATTDLRQLSHLIEKIQSNIDQSKQLLEAVQEGSDADLVANEPQMLKKTSSEPSPIPGPSSSLNYEINDHLLQQQERTKQQLDSLRRTICETLRELEKESQRFDRYPQRNSSGLFKNRSTTLQASNVFERHKKAVMTASQLYDAIARQEKSESDPRPGNRENEDKKRFQMSFVSEHSSHYSVGRGRFNCDFESD